MEEGLLEIKLPQEELQAVIEMLFLTKKVPLETLTLVNSFLLYAFIIHNKAVNLDR